MVLHTQAPVAQALLKNACAATLTQAVHVAVGVRRAAARRWQAAARGWHQLHSALSPRPQRPRARAHTGTLQAAQVCAPRLCRASPTRSVVGVHELVVGGERVEALLHYPLHLVGDGAHRGHGGHERLRAEVGLRLLVRVVRDGAAGGGQGRGSVLEGLVQRLAVSGQLGGALVRLEVLGARRDERRVHHLEHGGGLDLDGDGVLLVHDVGARLHLLPDQHPLLLKQGLVLRRREMGQRGHRVVQVEEAPGGDGLHGPLLGVAVASEHGAHALLEQLRGGVPVAHAALH
mmetsp:Transcript_5117/g.17190  ORF Transcript_5117/g.17190 Transcript_5117/m.17190 type:complete len:289 (-) Transcript_5117:107-973(-)